MTTAPGFTIDSPENGLVISRHGSLTCDDANPSTITGRGGDGIAVGNGGGASRILIRTAGDVSGLGIPPQLQAVPGSRTLSIRRRFAASPTGGS